MVMYGNRFPYRYWFIAIHLFTSTQKVFQLLNFKNKSDTLLTILIWAMLHKLRQIMGVGDVRYQLKEKVELGEGLFIRK
jgi:hypothetical protein